MPLKQLPDSILLCIVFESDVATLKQLRLVCHNFNALIQAYGKSIRAKALARDYSQDLVDCFDVLWREKNHLRALFVTDGRIQEARWMAAVRLRAAQHVYRRRDSWFDEVGRTTQDIMSMWEYVVMGLGIMWRLHDCATQEMCLDFRYNAMHAEEYMSDITIDYPQLENLEIRILHKQLLLVENLTKAHCESLYYALGFCVRVLYEVRRFARKSDPDREAGLLEWVKWLVLREGPTFVATAWRSEAVKVLHSELIGRAFTSRDLTQMDIERAGVTPLYEAVKQGIEPTGFCPSPPGSPYLIASDAAIAEFEHWSGEQGLAVTKWHLALGRPAREVRIIPSKFYPNMAVERKYS